MKIFSIVPIAVLGLGYSPAWAQTDPSAASLQKTFFCEAPDGTVSTYEIWLYDDPSDTPKDWNDARMFAESLTDGETGVPGHLVTFSDAIEEECFLEAASGLNQLGVNRQLWIGLSREVGGMQLEGFEWLDEPENDYRNWPASEPNNAGGNELWATVGRQGYDLEDGHNDEDPNRGTVYGFGVEFDNSSDLLDCLEDDDGVPPSEPSEGGCNRTGSTQLEYAEGLRQFIEPEDFNVTQALIPAKKSAQTTTCGLASDGETVLYPFIAKDPQVDSDGNPVGPQTDLDLSTLFDIEGYFAEFHPDKEVPVVIQRVDTKGAPCLALYYQHAPEFVDLATLLPAGFEYERGPVSTLTQTPENVPGMYAGRERITAPLNFCDLSQDSCKPVPECYAAGTQCFQPDLTRVEEATLQPNDRRLLIRPFAAPYTSDVFNASRTRSFKGTFAILNTRQVCLDLDPTLDPDTAEYLEAVFECKIEQTLDVADDLRLAIGQSDARGNLLSPAVNRLYKDLNKLRGQIKNAHFDRCLRYVQDLEDQVLGGEWRLDEFNDQGRVIMYTSHLKWRCEQLLETETFLDSFPKKARRGKK